MYGWAVPSQSEVRKRRLRAEARPATSGPSRGSRRRRQRRVIGLVAVVVAVMMVASLLVGLVSVI